MTTTEQQQIQQLTERVAFLEQVVLRMQQPANNPSEDKSVKMAKKAKKEGPTLNKDGTERKKRSAGGWDLFCADKRAGVRASLSTPEGDLKVKATDVSKELGRQWRELGEEGQASWKELAAEVSSED
jgi:hypothetical protein